jgi:hypothetical protein
MQWQDVHVMAVAVAFALLVVEETVLLVAVVT